MTVRREIAQSPSETGARSREGGRHTWNSMLTDWTASPPAWTPCQSRPGASSPRLRDRAPSTWSWREERFLQWILTSIPAIAAEAFMNDAG